MCLVWSENLMCKQSSRQFWKVFLAAWRPGFNLLAEQGSDVGQYPPHSGAWGTCACPEWGSMQARVHSAVMHAAGEDEVASPLSLGCFLLQQSHYCPQTLATHPLPGVLDPKSKASRAAMAETEENLPSSLNSVIRNPSLLPLFVEMTAGQHLMPVWNSALLKHLYGLQIKNLK